VARQWGENSHAIVDDLIQETYVKLCADRMNLLESFEPTRTDSVFGYIKVFAANLAQDYFKAARAKKRGGPSLPDSLETQVKEDTGREPHFSASKTERKVLMDEVAACLCEVAPGPTCQRDRRIFWLYYRVGLAASEIAALPGTQLSTKGVESTIGRLTRMVRQRLSVRERVAGASGESVEGIRPSESL
jgi:RNA polymerase sigma-70 factor, ECF subfamily